MSDRGPARARRLPAAFADRRGGVGEVLFWGAVFLGAVAAVADLSMIYTATGGMWDAARDAARRVAVHEMTPAQAKAQAARAVAVGPANAYKVEVTETDTDVIVKITADAAAISPVGIYAAIAPGALSAEVAMMKEPQ